MKVNRRKVGGTLTKGKGLMKFYFPFLVLIFSLVFASAILPAQGNEIQSCIIVLEGQNRNRTVDGVIDEECEPVNYVTQWHDPPWGNWGVSSNYSTRVENGDQFLGWEPKGSQKQWNSCTNVPEYPKFHPPNCEYYNADNCSTQASFGIVTHGQLRYRTSVDICVSGVPPDDYSGCQDQGSVGQDSNHMTLYELDKPDPDDLIETLYFPGTYVTLIGCTYEGCPERTSSWVEMSRSTDSTRHVEAELRMKARAFLEGSCDWNW